MTGTPIPRAGRKDATTAETTIAVRNQSTLKCLPEAMDHTIRTIHVAWGLVHTIEITNPGDERLADYVHLRESSLRRRLEAGRGIFIAEGAKVIRRAVETGHVPKSLMLAERWLAGLSDLLIGMDAPVYLVSEELAEQVTGFHVHRGALGAMYRREAWTLEQILVMDRVVVLEDIVDHTNVGAIIRCAAALGWQGAILAPRCADPLYRRAIKTSMGAVFSLPWTRLASHDLSVLHRAGFETVAMALGDDAVDLGDYAAQVRSLDRRIALVLGTEGAGISREWLARADLAVRIPMAAGIDSLNVATAAAVACYELAPPASSSSGETTSISG